jgi:hypothetical protein
MAFRPGSNRHDSWLRFCGLHRELLAGTGLPEAITQSEDRFRDLLRSGSAAGRGIALTLAGLSAEQWTSLDRFAAEFFRECESYAPLELFPAFGRETERRARSDSAE